MPCGRHICSGAYANNMKCMYNMCFPGHNVGWSDFLGAIMTLETLFIYLSNINATLIYRHYIHIRVWYLHPVIG